MVPSWLSRHRAVVAAVVAAAALVAALATRGSGDDPARTAVAGAAAPAPTATATRRPVEKAIWGPVAMPDGSSAFPVYERLGVDVYQVQLNWSATAPERPNAPADPGDPAYRWPKLVDAAVREAADHGIQVAIMVRGTPGWANGGRDASWAPDDPADYADFLRAAAARYPGVRRWMIWGEPTRPGNFSPMPQGSRTGPRRYALLLDAAYGALKQADRRNIVIGGMTWTVGLVSAPDFVRWMRLPDGTPPRMDWYGHNPFSTRFPKLKARPYVKGVRDINDIDTLHREVARAYSSPPGRATPKLWLSEFTVSSDRPNRAFSFAVSRRQQARWIAAAFRLVNSVSYVAGLGWFDLYDEDPSVSRSLTNGLMTSDGTPKPAFGAYRRAP